MNRAALYHRSNDVQRRDAKQVLDEFAHMLQWREDGQDSVLDIGCGTGDVTIDYILPLMPNNYSRLVGADLSEQMIGYARETYETEKISFEKLDIGIGIDAMSTEMEPFDHITSFYCLHWVQNQKLATKNIYRLLRPTGDCLVAFLASNPIYEIYKLLAQNVKWRKYMQNLNRFISPYQYADNPVEECEKILYMAGFRDYSVTLKNKKFYYREEETLRSKC